MLKHDGVLTIDQRNYDAILDGTETSSHTYYYVRDFGRAHLLLLRGGERAQHGQRAFDGTYVVRTR